MPSSRSTAAPAPLPPFSLSRRSSGLGRIIGHTFQLSSLSFIEKVLIASTLVVITMAALDRGLVPPSAQQHTPSTITAQQPVSTHRMLAKVP
jgi:hypothetical protein